MKIDPLHDACLMCLRPIKFNNDGVWCDVETDSIYHPDTNQTIHIPGRRDMTIGYKCQHCSVADLVGTTKGGFTSYGTGTAWCSPDWHENGQKHEAMPFEKATCLHCEQDIVQIVSGSKAFLIAGWNSQMPGGSWGNHQCDGEENEPDGEMRHEPDRRPPTAAKLAEVRVGLAGIAHELVHGPPKADIVTGETSGCVYCGCIIYAVIDAHSGMVDWGSSLWDDGTPDDFGCDASPDTDEEGCGSHDPGPNKTPLGMNVFDGLRAIHTQLENTDG